MARVLTYGALVATALMLQLTVLDLLPIPGGVAPNLVMLVVVAIALTSGPLPGLVTGFAAGLALDLAPPASHAIGAYALVFCLIGYLCGRAAGEIDRSAFLPLAAMALGAVVGSALYAVVGVIFGEPGVSWAAARNVLPLSAAYDVLLSPFVLYLVLRLTRWAGHAADDPAAGLARAASPATSRAARGRAGGKNQPRQPRLRPGTGRPAGRIGAGAPAGLRAAGGRSSAGWGGGAGTAVAHGGRQSPLPRLRFGSSKPTGMTPGARRPARTPRLRFGPSRLAGMTASGKAGVFSGGSLVGGSTVRLRLGTGRASRLRSRTGRFLGLAPHGHQPARPKFAAARSGTGPGAGRSGTVRSGTGSAMRRMGRSTTGFFGMRRSGSGFSGRPHSGRRRSGWPRSGWRRSSQPHFGGPRFGGSRFGGTRPGRSRPRGPRSGWMRSGGARTGLRRGGWLSGLRPRGGWSAIWRIGGRGTGGFR